MTDGEPQGAGWYRRLVTAAVFLVVVLTAFLVYSGSIHNEFVWDDPIVLNQQLQAFHSVGDVFFPPPRIPQFGGLYYRPMILVSYMMDRALLGDTPFAFHLPVVLMHALNSGLVFLLGIALFVFGTGRWRDLGAGTRTGALLAALAGGLLFATHPIHTESVCWMAGRSDNLATLFIIPSFLCYLRWKRERGRWIWLALAAVLFLGGCFSKETAAGFLLIVAAADLLGIGDPAVPARADRERARGSTAGSGAAAGKGSASRKGGKDDRKSGAKVSREAPPPLVSIPWAGWAAFGVAFLAYYGLRQKALTAYPETLRPSSPNPVTQILNVVEAIGFYIGKIFVPVHLDAYIPNIPQPGLNALLGAVTIVLAALAVGTAVHFGQRMIAFLILFFFGGLAPSLAIAFFSISEAPVAERYLYIPSVGFCLLLGYLGFVTLPALLQRRRTAESAAIAAEGASAGGGTGTGGADEAADALLPVPERAGGLTPIVALVMVATLALSGVYGAMTLRRERDWRADLAFWTDGVAKSPNEGLPHLHRGLALANLGRPDEAEAEYKLAIDPTVEYDAEGRSTALNNLGMLHMGKSELDKADDYFEQAIRMRPEYPTPYYGIGVTALRRGEVQGRAGQVQEASRNFEKSEAYFTRAIQLNPQYVKAHNQIAYLFATTGRPQPALEHLNRVLKLVSRGGDFNFARDLKQQIEQRTGNR